MKNISILGSTGSIGTQTLDVVGKNSDSLNVVALSAGENLELIYEQVLKYKPLLVSVNDSQTAFKLEMRLKGKSNAEVHSGSEGLIACATIKDADIVVTAISGMVGVAPTLAAIEAKKDIALANKETLVAAGDLVMKAAAANKVKILPVDSEHSAIFQAIGDRPKEEINKIILTASGGPFRGRNSRELEKVTIMDALNHPNWSMGKKITVDSATLMNKGLELIEAKHLFGVHEDNIQIIVHPQSIVHSAVEFVDKSTIAQLGLPDMRVPIQYALFYPKRVKNNLSSLELTDIYKLTFEEPDIKTFRCLKLAYDAVREGGLMPSVMNAANEKAVELFLKGRVKFVDIPSIVEYCMLKYSNEELVNIGQVEEARIRVNMMIEDRKGALIAYINN